MLEKIANFEKYADFAMGNIAWLATSKGINISHHAYTNTFILHSLFIDRDDTVYTNLNETIISQQKLKLISAGHLQC
jgi:hypothetical protein